MNKTIQQIIITALCVISTVFARAEIKYEELANAAQSESIKKTLNDIREKPDFIDYPVNLYTGKNYIPKEFRKESEGTWWDSNGKGMDIPRINFSGKYFLSTHSCGAECRYYRLIDLTTGNDISIMNMFTCAEPPPTTSDGYRYMTFLFFRPESNLLVAQYEIEKGETTECRERLFVLENEQLKPITGTRRYCNDWKKK